MSWNLEVHILDHSAATYNRLNSKRDFNPSDESNQHFTFSIDISQMILNHNCRTQEDIDIKLKLFMDDLLQVESSYKEIKGKNKKGVRMYRNVKFSFKDDVLVAYHNSASDSINSQNYTVNPHYHILFHRSVKLGRGFKYLKSAVENVAKKHNLVFNNMEKVDKPKTQGLGSKFTWFTKRATDKDFIKAFESGYLKRQLDTFQTEYKQTGNIQYLLKGYVDLQARLKRMKLKHNFDFTLFLNASQKRTIDILYSGERVQIQELLKDRSNAIARAYLEHTKGFRSIIIDQIEQRTSQTMPIVDLDINRIDINTTPKEKGDYTKTISYCYSQDLESVLRYAKNEKEMAAYFKKLGYADFKFKAKNISGKRQRVGFTFLNKNKNLTTVYFNSLKTDMKAIRFSLSENSKVSVGKVTTHLENYYRKLVSDVIYSGDKNKIEELLLETILKYAHNEKELAAYFKKLGYINFKFKTENISGSRQRVGYSFLDKNQQSKTVFFNTLKNLDMSIIKSKLKKNSEVSIKRVPHDTYSYIQNYIPKHLIKGEFVESNGFIYSLDLLNYKAKNEFQDLVNETVKSQIQTQEL